MIHIQICAFLCIPLTIIFKKKFEECLYLPILYNIILINFLWALIHIGWYLDVIEPELINEVLNRTLSVFLNRLIIKPILKLSVLITEFFFMFLFPIPFLMFRHLTEYLGFDYLTYICTNEAKYLNDIHLDYYTYLKANQQQYWYHFDVGEKLF